jgi:conjugal transfer ATP-binding protein TraC
MPSSYQNKIKKMLEHNPFSQLLPVIEFLPDEKVFILDGPAVGCLLICQPSPGSNSDIRNAFDAIYKSDYPEGTTIQCSLVSTPDIEDALFGYRAIREGRMQNKDKEQCEALANTILDFYREGSVNPINQSGFKFKNYEFWFTIKMPIKEPAPNEKELEFITETSRQCLSRLHPFSPYIATERDYHRRMRVLFNMYDTDGWRQKAHHLDKEYRTIPLRETILAPGKRLIPKIHGISIENEDMEECLFIKPLSIIEMPENMFYGQMMNLVGDWESGSNGLYEPFMLTLNLVFPDQLKAKASFFKKRTFITNQAQGPLLKFIDKLGFQKEDYDAIDRELTQENARLLKYSLQLTVFAQTEKKAVKFYENVKGFYSRLNVKIIPDNNFAVPCFLSSLPFGLDKTYIQYSSRFNDSTSKGVTFMTPHMASWKGNTPYPAFMMSSRFGQVVNMDFFNSQTNYNIYCAATSGAGKSFFTGYLVNCMLGSGIKKHMNPDKPDRNYDDGAQVFIVDVGRSYEGLASQYDEAQFLVFGRGFKYSMNPFPSIVDFYGQEGEANMLRTIVKSMAFPSGNVTDFQNSELLTILEAVWKAKGNKATITDVAELCLTYEDMEIIRIGQQLKPFTENGIYGSFFSDKNPPVSYDSRLIVCELEELKSDPHLQVVVLMSLVVSIQKQMYLSGTGRRKQLIIDEGWQYLKDEGSEAALLKFFAEFLETGWRRFRKVNGSGALVTQSVMDAYESTAGRAIIANSAWLLLMKQNDEAIDKLETEKMYAGSPSDFAMLRSLRTVKPNPGISDEAFSEVFVRFEGQKQVCRLYTDRKLQLILTTQPDEKALRQEYMDSGMTMVQAITQMYNDEKEASMGRRAS